MDPLFGYQSVGAEFLSGNGFGKLLADEMGLGKTVQAIRGLDRIHAKRAIIICPSVARINWLREFELWSLSKVKVSIVTELSDPLPTEGHVICSYNYATANFRRFGRNWWDCLVIDEAHFLKSTDAERAKAILGAEGIIRVCSRCWLLSGTPAPNNYGELWILLFTFGVTSLTYEAFIKRYCVVMPSQYGFRIVAGRPENVPELRELLSKIMLRRLKKDVMKELPPISFGHVNVEPGLVDLEILPSFTQYFMPTDRRADLKAELDRQRNLLEQIDKNMAVGDTNKLSAIAAVSDSVSTLRRYIGLQKCDAAIELLANELENKAYEKVVIFAIHRDVIETMRMGLRKFGPVVLYGGTDPEKRQKNIDRFQNNKKCRVFIGNIHAAGTAITLTAADQVVFIELDWVPGNNAQAIMRCHRIGQLNKVFVRFLLLDGTLDAKIGFILKRKIADLAKVFD